MKKNYLDEMQERKLLQIEHNACWLAFWGLSIVTVGQMILWPGQAQTVAGEWILMMVLSLYLAIAPARNGIWERRTPASHRANLLISLPAALVAGGVTALIMWQGTRNLRAVAVSGMSTGVLSFFLVFLGLSVVMAISRHRRNQLDGEE